MKSQLNLYIVAYIPYQSVLLDNLQNNISSTLSMKLELDITILRLIIYKYFSRNWTFLKYYNYEILNTET